MLIQVNDQWRIRTASEQYVLERKAKADPKRERKGEGWTIEGYFSHVREIWPVLHRKQIVALEGEYGIEALVKLDESTRRIEAEIKAAMRAERALA